jgi:hypothetical protein
MPARKLTPKVRQAIGRAVSAGSSYRAAAECAGVSDRTLRSWLARGRAERDAPRLAAGEAPYVRLVESLERAGARAEVRAAALITKASEMDWHAAAWFLSRRDPESWGTRVAVEHDDSAGTFEQLLEEATDEELAVLQDLAMRHGRNGS